MSELDRRQFLTRGALTIGAAGAGVAGGLSIGGDSDAAADPAQEARDSSHRALASRYRFDGPHQAGVVEERQDQAAFVALDAVAPLTTDLTGALRALSYRARQLMLGGATGIVEPDLDPTDDPPLESGILGTTVLPDALTITIGFGASLFDDRFGLSGRKPAGLIEMPRFAIDRIDPALSHGDVMLQVCAGSRDTVVHAVRELLRTVRGALEPRWAIDGFQSAQRDRSPKSSTRNLFAFRDGTANPDVSDAKLMDRLVWTQPGSGMPAWAVGGTYQVVRVIRMHVEFWDRVGMREQEQMIGRVRQSGAPLGGTQEHQDPRYDLDPKGDRIPLDAHIRLANPRTKASDDERILRRPYNYSRGFDSSGALDQGMVFVAFNQDPARQFAAIQGRLDDEPMIDYITPVGGGYFFVPPGTRGDKFGWIGQSLFTA